MQRIPTSPRHPRRRALLVDHGDGISAELTEKVFLPFYRGDESRTRDGRGGAGLGLALAKQIAEEHEGYITVQPTDGGGATFTLTVPSVAVGGP